MTPSKRQAYVLGIAKQYGTRRLQEWSHSILATPHADAALMVAEDPSVMDIAAAYILKLEARVRELELAAGERISV